MTAGPRAAGCARLLRLLHCYRGVSRMKQCNNCNNCRNPRKDMYLFPQKADGLQQFTEKRQDAVSCLFLFRAGSYSSSVSV
jgi:hypothetical protein